MSTIWSEGSGVFTCGGHTGHVVRTVAFCMDDATAKTVAETLNSEPSLSAKIDVMVRVLKQTLCCDLDPATAAQVRIAIASAEKEDAR